MSVKKIKKIKVPILWRDEDSITIFEDLGIDTKPDLEDYRIVTFYSVIGHAPYMIDGTECSLLYTNGEAYICSLKEEELEKIIEENLK